MDSSCLPSDDSYYNFFNSFRLASNNDNNADGYGNMEDENYLFLFRESVLPFLSYPYFEGSNLQGRIGLASSSSSSSSVALSPSIAPQNEATIKPEIKQEAKQDDSSPNLRKRQLEADSLGGDSIESPKKRQKKVAEDKQTEHTDQDEEIDSEEEDRKASKKVERIWSNPISALETRIKKLSQKIQVLCQEHDLDYSEEVSYKEYSVSAGYQEKIKEWEQQTKKELKQLKEQKLSKKDKEIKEKRIDNKFRVKKGKLGREEKTLYLQGKLDFLIDKANAIYLRIFDDLNRNNAALIQENKKLKQELASRNEKN